MDPNYNAIGGFFWLFQVAMLAWAIYAVVLHDRRPVLAAVSTATDRGIIRDTATPPRATAAEEVSIPVHRENRAA